VLEGLYFVELGAGESEVRYFRVEPTVDTAVQDPAMPEPPALRLLPASPNPFNGTTTIGYTAPHGPVRLDVLDLLGQHVRSLDEADRGQAGGTARWDGRDDDGQAVAGGVYLVRLQAGPARRWGRVLLLQ
jgi:hypothetical protein